MPSVRIPGPGSGGTTTSPADRRSPAAAL